MGHIAPKAFGLFRDNKYRAAKKSANRKMEKALKDFVTICSLKLLKNLKSTNRLKSAKDASSLLSAYQDLDSKLSKFEDSVGNSTLRSTKQFNMRLTSERERKPTEPGRSRSAR